MCEQPPPVLCRRRLLAFANIVDRGDELLLTAPAKTLTHQQTRGTYMLLNRVKRVEVPSLVEVHLRH